MQHKLATYSLFRTLVHISVQHNQPIINIGVKFNESPVLWLAAAQVKRFGQCKCQH